MCKNREDCESIAPVKPAALLQENRASANRTQADHSRRDSRLKTQETSMRRRESLMSSSSQEPKTSEKRAAMFSFGSEEPGNQFKSSVFKHADPSNLGRSHQARSGTKLQWKIVLRFQSTSSDSKLSFHAEPRQTPAS